MLRTIKPKNARSKRALEKRAPKLVENPKKTLFVRGESTSEITQHAVTDLHSLKAPFAQKFSKKNKVRPFEDVTPLEFFSQKNDTSLLVLNTHSKKRPHNLTFARTFDGHLLDMYELGLDPETFRPMESFKNATGKIAVGMKPMLVFSGAILESETGVYAGLRSYFMDFFRGPTVEKIDVSGLQYIISIAAAEPKEEGDMPRIHLRVYKILTKRSGHKLPRIELEEMGPRMDFSVRRTQLPADDMMKEALKVSRKLVARSKKNIETDVIGDKIGRIHLGKQEIEKMQTRKMKGLKRRKDGEDDTSVADAPASSGEATTPKKKKRRGSEAME